MVITIVRRFQPAIAAYAIRDFLICVILIYGYVYTAYKYGNPFFGRNDFFKYEAMIGRPFDLSAVSAPFALRQIPTLVASMFYWLGAHYDTAATIDSLGFDVDTKRRFFALLLSNALAVCLSFSMLSIYLRARLSRYSITELFSLFGILAAWFYFPTAVVAPLTVGWGWFASSIFAIAILERNTPLTCVACIIAIFSRETTLIFGVTMILAPILFEGERQRSVVVPLLILIAGCLAFLALRLLFTKGYEHQILPASVVTNFLSYGFSREFLWQSVLSQGLLALLLLLIVIKRPRYAGYLVLATGAVVIVAMGAAAQIDLLLGETLPFYALIFLMAWQDNQNDRLFSS